MATSGACVTLMCQPILQHQRHKSGLVKVVVGGECLDDA
jgi:hypothetical protein